jgi:anti-sigma regulatory factor (Ser/Thr protein kinase)
MCEHLGLAGELTERIRLAVTEACTNCVLHAYGDATSATFAVEARVEGDWLLLVVRDYGRGMTPGRQRGDTLNVGLDLIEELADSASVSTRPGRGTRVAMRFAIPPAAWRFRAGACGDEGLVDTRPTYEGDLDADQDG